jgi:hypothetical protein
MRIISPHCGQETDVAVIDGNDCIRLIMQFAPLSGQRGKVCPSDNAKSTGHSSLAWRDLSGQA